MPNFDTNKGPVNYRTNLTGLSVAGAVVTGGVVLGKVINNIKNGEYCIKNVIMAYSS